MGHRALIVTGFIAAFAATSAAAGEEQGDARDAPIVEALLTVGTPYRRGGTSPDTGFDCSGLVLHVFQRAWGLSLPRSVEAQRLVGKVVKRQHQLEPGDLVFYNTRNRPYSHVGIYVGGGQFVHAPRPGRRVRIENIDSPYWRARFNGARRLQPDVLS
jgi:cell wall-associated NlpC family hydrolase